MHQKINNVMIKSLLFLIQLNILFVCVQSIILTPPYFNLVSNKKVHATATCGEREKELYCKLTGSTASDREAYDYTKLIQGQYCDYCDPNDPEKIHQASYAIDGTDKWWQSPPLSRSLDFNKVNLTIDLGQEFHVAYVYIKMANSPRPGVWALEKSVDNGLTYQPWQYFADTPSDCINFFNVSSNKRIENDDDVVCTTDYSKVLPVEGGEILVSLVNNRPNSKNFSHADMLQNWTRATNVRLRLLRTKSLLGHLMAVAKQDPTVTRRYFYSIRDISIGGRCVCNGHAQHCEASNSLLSDKLICRCSHNTCGDQCETCCEGFVQKRWRQNRENQEFECEPCQCYGHSSSCVYNATVDQNKESIDIHGNYEGGGVCQNCEHNTQGINCQECKSGYYRPYNVHISSVNACRKCNCDNRYSTGNCAQLTGKCECKPQYEGDRCEKCALGYKDWPICKKCDCDVNGRADFTCDLPCNCKFGFLGPYCDKCVDRYFGFPNCRPCECDREGSIDWNCNKETGQCICRPGYTGLKCDQCDNGYYGDRMCTVCNCDSGTADGICDKKNGTCICAPNFQGERCSECAQGFYNFPNCLPCECDREGSLNNNCKYFGNQQQCDCKRGRSGPKCDRCAPGYYKYPDCIECQCDESGTIGQSCDPITGKCNCKSNFIGDKCSDCAPDLYNYPVCEPCSCDPRGTTSDFPGCNKDLKMIKIICPCKENVYGTQCEKCKDRFYGLGSDEKGCSPCQCNKNGSLNELDLCEQEGGQCYCKLFADSISCAECKRGFYKLKRNDLFGCQSCDCLPGSSIDTYNCDKNTGQCSCLPNIIGARCDNPAKGYYFPNLHQFKYELEDGFTGDSKGYKSVRYDFNESLFSNFSWKGYVNLNTNLGEVVQNVSITKPGTYRMIIKYLNKNSNISQVFVRVWDVKNPNDEQNSTVFLQSNKEPSFETITTNQISALILELEEATYSIGFKNKMQNIYIDYFVLLPSDYFESTALTEKVEKACEDYRNQESCVQYSYPSLDAFFPIKLYNGENNAEGVDLDSIKSFNHSFKKPLLAVKLNSDNKITRNLKFPSPNTYVLLIEFMNINEDGKEIKVDITHLDNRKQSGRVYLYRCNITTVCREVVLLSDYNEPIKLEGKDAANIVLSSPNDASIVLVYQLTLVPKEKFSVNHIKLAPYCIVRNKTCEQFEYLPLTSTVVKFESDDKNLRQDLYRTPSHAYDYIPSTHIAFLHNFFPEITIPVKTNNKEQLDQVMIVHYYQPNHDIVNVEVFLDKKINGTFSAPYCPSISGCRDLIKFESNSETFNNPDLQSVKFQLKYNGKDIWLASISIAPAASVNDETLQPVPTDLTSKFITECASDHFNINYYNSKFCDESVVSLSAKINEGALKCNCDLDGSVNSEECEKFGGQCECKENIIGRTCTRCKTGYFGFPNCKKCDCVIGNCDDITGECISPPYSHKNGTCFDDYYGYHVVMGCVECNCDLNGTENQKKICNKENGQCKCKENTDGLRCDVCKAGFFDYPDCEECTCNREGSVPQICDTETAECKCKENVYGERCDECKYGTFNLEHRNPKGCTQCFCFGLVNQCRKSDLFFRSERDFDIDKWSLAYTKLSANQSSIDITIVNTDESDGLKLNIDENTNFKITESLYWSAPYKYTGNKVTSYGGAIRYKIRIKNSENIQPLIRPDLILVSSQNMTLVHTSLLQPLNDRVFENKVDLIESEFKHLLTGTSATREQLMIVLSSLNEVKLRAIYFSKIHMSELLDFEMDVAQKYDAQIANVPANSAEQCNCPPNFSGYSCESCEYGYYKVKSTGPGLFNCLPCNCSGHADTCDQETEECIDCRDNTYGKNCEFCKKGYYRVEYPNGQSECRMCPCPGPYDSNIFADSCLYEENSKQVYYCQCNEGYTGQYCERCAPGYYGDPTRPGGKCLPCQCNNNIDTNDYDSCDQRTGACLKCLNNTSGLNCERCADWHYGDALSPQKCKPCSCDKCGTQICDAKNGDCLCKNNVIGHNCGSCGSDMWGFNNCNGCNKCNCDPVGSTSTQCDPITGQCKCKAGITSKTCNQCQSDHWNFGENGCQNCNCSKDGVQMSDTGGFKCNSTSGHCTCIPGVIGEKCDRCAPRWVLVKHVGCQSCDTCIHTLLDDIEELFTKADSIESGNKDSSLTFKAQSKLTKLDKEFSFVKSIDPSQYDSTILANLQRTIKQAQKELVGLKLMTELDMNEKIKNYTALLNDAEIFNKDLNELRLKLDVLDQIITDLDREDITDFKNITDVQMGIYENIVDQISIRDFNLTIDRHLDFLKEYEQYNKTIKEIKVKYDEHLSQIDIIKIRNSYIHKSLNELKSLIDNAKNLERTKDKDVAFKAYYENLEQIRKETISLQQNSGKALENITKLIEEGHETLDKSNKELNDLTAKVEDLKELYNDHENKYSELKQKCSIAEKKTSEISSLALNWQTKVQNTQKGLVAFEAAQVYEKITNTLNSAHDKSSNNLKQYSEANLRLGNLTEQTDELKKKGEEISRNVENEITKKVKAELDHSSLNNDYNNLDRKSKDLVKSLEKIDQWVNKTLNSDQTLTSLRIELDGQQENLKENEKEAEDLIRKIQSLDSLRGSLPKPVNSDEDSQLNTSDLPNGEQLIKSIDESIDKLKDSGPIANNTLKKLLEENTFASSNELDAIEKEMFDLKNLIDSIRRTANEIKVPIKFNDSTLINLKSPDGIHPSISTVASLYLKTKESYAPIALIYNESNPNEYLSLYLQQGRPYFQYKLSKNDQEAAILSTDLPINNNQWHKIEIERIGKLAKLKVYSENNFQEKIKESSDDSIVFNIDPNGAKFLLGQFPYSQLSNDLNIIAANNQFRGSIDSVQFNGFNLGLWNYLTSKNINGELTRKFVAPNDQKLESTIEENGVYFKEESFMCLNSSSIKFSVRSSIDVTIKFKTQSSNGLIWIWYNDEKQFLAIYLDQGHINVAFVLSEQNKIYLFEKQPNANSYKLDDNKYHTIKVTVGGSKVRTGQQYQNPYLITMNVVERFDQDEEKKIDEVVHSRSDIFKMNNGKQCIGGLLPTDRENTFKDDEFNSFTGCMISLSTNNKNSNKNDFKSINLQEAYKDSSIKAVNIEQNCPTTTDQCEIKKSNMPVYLQFDAEKYVRNDNQEIIGISFVTTNPNGVLFYRLQNRNKEQTNIYLLELKDTQIYLKVFDSSNESSENDIVILKTNGKYQYNDNKLHVTYVIRKRTSIELRVDNELVDSVEVPEIISSNQVSLNILYAAGVPENQRKKMNDETFINFEGCLMEIIYNNNELKLSKANSRTEKFIKYSSCYSPKVRASYLNHPGFKDLQRSVFVNRFSQAYKQYEFDKEKNGVFSTHNDECVLSKQYDSSQLKSVGLRFGLSKQSRLEIHDSFPIKISTFVSFKFRTLHMDGLMFYSSDAQFNDFIAVWLQDGYVNYAFDCGSGSLHVKSKRMYSDGRYHTISIKRDKQFGVLIISDRTNSTIIETIEGQSIGQSNSLNVAEPYYFGNIPETDKLQLPAAQSDLIVIDPFVGCMSDFNIGYKQLKNNFKRIDLMNCSNNHESGLFFTGHSLTSYSSLFDYITLSDAFEITFEFKSRTKNGVVLYIGNKNNIELNKNYALLELVNGDLIYKINIDGIENHLKYKPDVTQNELCNSSWVRVKLRKDNYNSLISMELKGNELTCQIDDQVNSSIKSKLSHSNSLFIGALPSRASYAEITQTNEPYTGCIRDLTIKKNNEYTINKALLEMNLEPGVLNYCPLK